MSGRIAIVFFLVIYTLPARSEINKEFTSFANHQDSLLTKAYKMRDVSTQAELSEELSKKYNELSNTDKEVFRSSLYNSFYNLACTYSLLNNKSKSLEYIEKAIRSGYQDYDHMIIDPDLSNIRHERRFKLLTGAIREISYYSKKIRTAYINADLDSMVYYAQQMVRISIKNEKNLPPGTHAFMLSILANALWNVGNYPDAKETYFKALEKAEPVDDPFLMANIYNGLAMVNRNEGNFRQAITYYTKAEDLVKDVPDNDELLTVLGNKGKAYEQLNILDSAFTYTQECLSLMFRKYGQKNVLGGGVQADMGIIYSKLGKEKLANEFFRLSFQLNKEVNEQRLLARGYYEFAEHFQRYHLRDSAIYYATKGLQIDREHHFLVQLLAASTLLSQLYTEENKIDSAFKYQSIMIATRDTMFSREKINRLQNLEFDELLRQQEMETARRIAEEERRQNIQYILIALCLVTFIILFLLLSRSFITNTKLIQFLGVVALLIVFEFLNLLLHPYVEKITHHIPVLALLASVCIAALLVPLHHRLEKWATVRLVEKNKEIRLARAKQTIEKLDAENKSN